MVAGGRPEAVLDAARLAPVEQGTELLTALAEHGIRYEWSRLRGLVEREAPTIDSGVLSLSSGLEQPEAVAWLIAGIARPARRSPRRCWRQLLGPKPESGIHPAIPGT